MRGTLEAIIRPLVEQVGIGYCVIFLARLQADYIRDQHIQRGGSEVDASFRQARAELQRQLSNVPTEVFRRRFRLSARMAIAALAEHRRASPAGQIAAGELEDLVTDLVDATAGLLRAPSTRTGQSNP